MKNDIKFYFKICAVFFLFFVCAFFNKSGFGVFAAGSIKEFPVVRQKDNDLVLTIAYERTEKENLFINQCLDSSLVSSSIPNLGITNNAVRFVIPKAVKYTMYRNDAPYPYKSGERIPPKDAGNFSLHLINLDRKDTGYEEVTERFIFKLVDKDVNSPVDFINAPPGFFISSVKELDVKASDQKVTEEEKTDAREVVVASNDFYKIERPGVYFVTFTSKFDKSIYYVLQINKTNKIGSLVEISGIKNNKAVSDVVEYQAKEGTTVTLQKNGEVLNNRTGKISEPGDYVITAVDNAGNIEEYSFTYKYRPTAVTYVLIVVLSSIFVLSPLYLFKMRVGIKVR